MKNLDDAAIQARSLSKWYSFRIRDKNIFIYVILTYFNRFVSRPIGFASRAVPSWRHAAVSHGPTTDCRRVFILCFDRLIDVYFFSACIDDCSQGFSLETCRPQFCFRTVRGHFQQLSFTCCSVFFCSFVFFRLSIYFLMSKWLMVGRSVLLFGTPVGYFCNGINGLGVGVVVQRSFLMFSPNIVKDHQQIRSFFEQVTRPVFWVSRLTSNWLWDHEWMFGYVPGVACASFLALLCFVSTLFSDKQTLTNWLLPCCAGLFSWWGNVSPLYWHQLPQW